MPTSHPYRYRHCGVTVESAIRLPHWRTDTGGGAAEVRISCSRASQAATPPFEQFDTVGQTIRFAVENVGEWRVDDGAHIAIRAGPGVDEATLALFTAGSAWAAIGAQRGWVQWHGSAVSFGSRDAWFFAGASGTGKSSLAAKCIERGGRLVADDFSRIAMHERPMIYPSSTRIRLADNTRFGTGAAGPVLMSHKTYRPVPSIDAEQVALGTIVLLEWGDGPQLVRLTGAEAVAELIAQTAYRPELDMLTGRETINAQAALIIVNRLPVFRFVRPEGGDLDEAADFLLKELAVQVP